MNLTSSKKVSSVVIRRLPRYYRYLGELLTSGITRISSKELSARMGVTASQIRQDLNCFGGFGQQGYGYNVEYLHKEMGKILGLSVGKTMIIIGAGNLGRAIAGYTSFERRGFKLMALFDNNPDLFGKEISKNVTIHSTDELESYVSANGIDIAVLTLPKQYAQEITERLASCGIKGIWNFSHMEISAPKGIVVENVHMSDSLMTLSCKIERLHQAE